MSWFKFKITKYILVICKDVLSKAQFNMHFVFAYGNGWFSLMSSRWQFSSLRLLLLNKIIGMACTLDLIINWIKIKDSLNRCLKHVTNKLQVKLANV